VHSDRMKPKIFINYRFDLNNSSAQLLYARLVPKHFDEDQVFLDKKGLTGAMNWQAQLVEQVRECAAMIVLIGKDWLAHEDESGNRKLDNRGDNVRAEIAQALGSQKILVPLLIDGAEPLRVVDLPEDIQGLAAIHVVRFTTEQPEESADRLAAALQSQFDQRFPPPPPPPPPRSPLPIVASGIVGIAAGIAGTIFGAPMLGIPLGPSGQVPVAGSSTNVTTGGGTSRNANPHQAVAATEPRPALPSQSASQAGLKIKDCADCPTMIVLPKGRLQPANELDKTDISIDYGLAVGQHEVTRKEFAAFVEARSGTYEVSSGCVVWSRSAERYLEDKSLNWSNPGFPGPDDRAVEQHPVVCVNWYDAKAYVIWLAQKTKKPYRLLTQSEWRYAASARSKGPFSFGDDASRLGDFAWFDKNANGETHAVGTRQKNERGLFDVHGNAWEWVADCWTPDLSRLSETAEPMGLGGDCDRHIIKGGGWESDVLKVRSAQRTALPNNAATPSLGFRVVRDMSE